MIRGSLGKVDGVFGGWLFDGGVVTAGELVDDDGVLVGGVG